MAKCIKAKTIRSAGWIRVSTSNVIYPPALRWVERRSALPLPLLLQSQIISAGTSIRVPVRLPFVNTNMSALLAVNPITPPPAARRRLQDRTLPP